MNHKFNEKYPPADSCLQGAKTYICGLKSHLLRSLALGIVLLVLASSCFEQGDCLVTNTTLVRVNLKKLKNRADTTITFTSVKLENGLVVYENKALTLLELPVDPYKTVTTFVLQRGTRTDQLTFQYRNESRVLSPTCGAYIYQKDMEVINNSLGVDSVRWINRQLFKSLKSNVEVYF